MKKTFTLLFPLIAVFFFSSVAFSYAEARVQPTSYEPIACSPDCTTLRVHYDQVPPSGGFGLMNWGGLNWSGSAGPTNIHDDYADYTWNYPYNQGIAYVVLGSDDNVSSPFHMDFAVEELTTIPAADPVEVVDYEILPCGATCGTVRIYYDKVPPPGGWGLTNWENHTMWSGAAGPSNVHDNYADYTFGDPYVPVGPRQYVLASSDDFTSPFTINWAFVKIAASPFNGTKTVGVPFTVNVTVHSDDEAFNAARANVAVSSNLTINSISAPTSNSCNMQYTQTPTTGNPSFAGAIYGSSSESCTVYTMVLTPNEEGTGTVTFTNGSVKSYEDNSEILIDVTDASFTLGTGPTPTPTPMLEFQVTSPAQTYKTNYNLAGTKLSTITSIFVNGSDEDSTYPTSTTWSVPVTLTLGNNTYTIYGSDGSNQTATQTFAVDRHILGDINGDGEIDLIDASLFAVDWDKTEDLTYVLSDMNDDGVVDLTDLSILAKLQE